jgi:hypothetical protein
MRYFRARRMPAGFLFLAASIFFHCLAPAVFAQFPIRQLPSGWNGPAVTPRPSPPANALPVNFGLMGKQQVSPPSGPAHPAVARIVVPEKDGFSFGSGTLIDARGEFGLVVSNWHVVRDAAGTISVEFPDGFKSPAQVVRLDKDWDLAALSIRRPQTAPVPISGDAPRPGDRLTIGGYGSGAWRLAAGTCTQYLSPGVDFPQEMLEVGVEARQGDSGGPIFNERGELAGVLFGSGPGYTSGSYGGRVLKFLATVIPGGLPGSDQMPPPNALLADTTHQPNGTGNYEPHNSSFADSNAARSSTLDVAHGASGATASIQSSDVAGTNRVAGSLLTPPSRADAAARFGPGPSLDDEEVDPRVAVRPPRGATSGPSFGLPADSGFSAGPPVVHTSLMPRVGTENSAATDLNNAPPEKLLAAAWRQLGGTTPFDQAKTILAIFGGLAVLVAFWRVSKQREPEREED